MPNPVAVVQAPLTITEEQNLRAESFVATLVQVLRAGTAGLSDSSLLTDATIFPQGTDKAAAALHLATRDEQLFFRQLGIAISRMTLGEGDVFIPPYVENSFTSTGLARGRGVYLSGAGSVSQGSNADDAHALIIGMSQSAAASGAAVSVIAVGTLGAVLTGATPGTEYFLGASGEPVIYSSLSSGQRIVRLGIASSATDLEVRIADLGVR